MAANTATFELTKGTAQFTPKFDLEVPVFDGSLFSWKRGEGCAEASTIGVRPGQRPYKQAYSDAADAACRVRSKTGVVMDFVLSKVDTAGYGEDEEVVGWRFTSPGGITLLIIND